MSARARYAESMFESRVFTPTSPTVRKPPAGRRRDQTTAELMGHYDDKALRAEPKKTFVPRELTQTAHDRKLNFLSSDILPRADTTPNPVVKTRGSPQLGEIVLQYNGEEPEVDHIMRRQTELSS
eukprot:CAMPEP_0194478532 /NCGR_PEP_ID=MMETSP0253-20130528/1946_1 /TAXON_ID=2966 /ORGANISM="Noctiluca scintillans" /LENGTH=124 /DNA_ID=CAMNT_0039317631 /DNA_START=46 /DNA_END=416 /DNA_ORIENTATION=+